MLLKSELSIFCSSAGIWLWVAELRIVDLNVLLNRRFSFSRNRTGTSLQVRLMWGAFSNGIVPHEPSFQASNTENTNIAYCLQELRSVTRPCQTEVVHFILTFVFLFFRNTVNRSAICQCWTKTTRKTWSGFPSAPNQKETYSQKDSALV